MPRFTPIAEALVSLLQLTPGGRFVDLGTGTGLVATIASRGLMPYGLVIGVDPSMGMLARVPTPTIRRIVARAPGLPFADSSVDVVAANLVLSHIPDLADGVRDVARVLRVGGRLGATAWAADVPAGPGNDGPEADKLLATAKAECHIPAGPPTDDAVPHQEWLQDEQHLLSTFRAAGFEDVHMESRRFERRTPVADLLAGWGSHSRYGRAQVGAQRWDTFEQKASEVLRRRFGESIAVLEDVWFVVGHRR